MNLKLKFTFRKSDIVYYALCLYTLSILFSDNTLIFYGCALIFGALGGLSWIGKKSFSFHGFPALYVLFILFCGFCAFLDTTFFPGVVIKRCIVMALNVFICYIAADELKDTAQRKRYLHFFAVAALVFEIYLIVLSGPNIMRGRLGEYANSPISFSGHHNANFVACILLYALIFDLDDYLKTKDKLSMLRMVLFVGGILLTGSRKGLISVCIAISLLPLLDIFDSKRDVFLKIMKYSLVGIAVIVVGLLLLFKVPALYEIAGKRIEAMFAVFGAANSRGDSSMEYRALFIEEAKKFFYTSPIVGIGIDNFKYVNFIKGYYAHNNYWEILTGSGIIGFTIFYTAYILLGVNLWKARRKHIPNAAALLVYLFIMVLTDYFLVSYLERLNLLLLFVGFSVTIDPCNRDQAMLKGTV